MLSLERLYHDVRHEGLNGGLPMTFVKLGDGVPYPKVDDLLSEIIKVTLPSGWVCIEGDDATEVGMGVLIKGLSACQLHTEIIASSFWKDPSWMHSVSRWCLNYRKDGMFNVFKLRNQDMLRFMVSEMSDFEPLKEAFKEVNLFPGTRVLSSHPRIWPEVVEFASRYDRTRVYKWDLTVEKENSNE